MTELSIILAGFADAFTWVNLLFVAIGVAAGQMVGAIPGIGPIMAMAIAIPFTFVLDPLVAISFLGGINKGGLFGGAIPAVLINTPGTPDAAATRWTGTRWRNPANRSRRRGWRCSLRSRGTRCRISC